MAKNHHGKKRADRRPQDADHGLLVVHRQVAPCKDREEFAIGPDVAPVMALGAPRLEDEDAIAGGGFGAHAGEATDLIISRTRSAKRSRPKRARTCAARSLPL